MTAARQGYEDLHQLIDQLAPEQLREARSQVLRLVHSRPQPTETDAEGLPTWFGAFRAGQNDAARRTEERLREGVRTRRVIVVDTGPIVAAAFSDDADHERCVKEFASGGRWSGFSGCPGSHASHRSATSANALPPNHCEEAAHERV